MTVHSICCGTGAYTNWPGLGVARPHPFVSFISGLFRMNKTMTEIHVSMAQFYTRNWQKNGKSCLWYRSPYCYLGSHHIRGDAYHINALVHNVTGSFYLDWYLFTASLCHGHSCYNAGLECFIGYRLRHSYPFHVLTQVYFILCDGVCG